ncbi:aftiphilin a isoform X1 [Scleropages formosus]|uniref:Aftiphilin a n=1 Tax=Scleropages formosus TaxID=113540 RepID=A0A8C9QQ77_SCLFO|nr:aftiphilin isoform X1 [Scleropages formosus]
MEPEVARMYSSSPPPLDDGAEDDDDEFGDFGGFSGVPPSVSFTEFDTPATFGQPQSAVDTSPPSLFNNISGGPGPFGGPSVEEDSASSDTDIPGADSCSSRDGTDDWKKLADQTRPSPFLNSADTKMGSSRTEFEVGSCNGGSPVTVVLTNGFSAFDMQETPFCLDVTHPQKKGFASGPTLEDHPASPVDKFADFSAFSNTVTPMDICQATDIRERRGDSSDGKPLSDVQDDELSRVGLAEANSEKRVTGIGSDTNSSTEAVQWLSNGEGSLHIGDNFDQSDTEPIVTHQGCEEPAVHSDSELTEMDTTEGRVSPEHAQERSVDQEEESCDSPSNGFSEGCSMSPAGLDHCGDLSQTSFAPLQMQFKEDATTSTDFGKVTVEPEDEDFGDFGDATTCNHQGFADFDQVDSGLLATPDEQNVVSRVAREPENEEDFGDFDSPKGYSRGKDGDDGEMQFADFPGSDSFADFSSAPVDSSSDFNTGWNAFGDQEQGGDDSWAAFDQEQRIACTEDTEERWQASTATSAPLTGTPQTSRRESLTLLASRLERLFQASFPEAPILQAGEEVLPLQALLEPLEKQQEQSDEQSTVAQGWPQDMWQQLRDIHNALGLRHQWGGSHCNRTLLCSLGIDTRNILFTGQKKQPVIVPMYAASLGMLEPTKEPVKPISAAEKIASIAQASPVSPEISSCSSDPTQETLPPIQFDWSSSGLTNPLDASGGSSLLNLDFFGPVEDSGSSSATSIPGVDPELYELTTAKLDTSGATSRVADAFARLMSTMEKTSTSTRKPRKEENLSEEAAKVIAGLPDLSFMQAKVLMFPATLTPLGSCSSSASSTATTGD